MSKNRKLNCVTTHIETQIARHVKPERFYEQKRGVSGSHCFIERYHLTLIIRVLQSLKGESRFIQ